MIAERDTAAGNGDGGSTQGTPRGWLVGLALFAGVVMFGFLVWAAWTTHWGHGGVAAVVFNPAVIGGMIGALITGSVTGITAVAIVRSGRSQTLDALKSQSTQERERREFELSLRLREEEFGRRKAAATKVVRLIREGEANLGQLSIARADKYLRPTAWTAELDRELRYLENVDPELRQRFRRAGGIIRQLDRGWQAGHPDRLMWGRGVLWQVERDVISWSRGEPVAPAYYIFNYLGEGCEYTASMSAGSASSGPTFQLDELLAGILGQSPPRPVRDDEDPNSEAFTRDRE
jgi:hypothetical protein